VSTHTGSKGNLNPVSFREGKKKHDVSTHQKDMRKRVRTSGQEGSHHYLTGAQDLDPAEGKVAKKQQATTGPYARAGRNRHASCARSRRENKNFATPPAAAIIDHGVATLKLKVGCGEPGKRGVWVQPLKTCCTRKKAPRGNLGGNIFKRGSGGAPEPPRGPLMPSR